MTEDNEFTEEIEGLEPVLDRILLRRDDPYRKWKQSGLEIPEGAGNYMDRLNLCTVLGAGEGANRLFLKAGDRVLIGKYAGTDIHLWGEDLTIVREDEILCLVTERKNEEHEGVIESVSVEEKGAG